MTTGGASSSTTAIVQFNTIYEDTKKKCGSLDPKGYFEHLWVGGAEEGAPLGVRAESHDPIDDARIRRLAHRLVRQTREEMKLRLPPSSNELEKKLAEFDKWIPPDTTPKDTSGKSALQRVRDEIDLARDSLTPKVGGRLLAQRAFFGFGIGAVAGVFATGVTLAALAGSSAATMGIAAAFWAGVAVLGAAIGAVVFGIVYLRTKALCEEKRNALTQVRTLEEQQVKEQWNTFPLLTKILFLANMGKDFRDEIKSKDPGLAKLYSDLDDIDDPSSVEALLDVLNENSAVGDIDETLDYLYLKKPEAFESRRCRRYSLIQQSMHDCRIRNKKAFFTRRRSITLKVSC